MKRFLAIAIAATIGLTFAGTVQAATDASSGTYGVGANSVNLYSAGMSANGIQASRHNLGSMGTAISATPSVGSASSTSEICVFCHTPHHTVQGTAGDTTGIGNGLGNGSTNDYTPAPIWNRRSAATSFTAYGTTIGGTNTTLIGGVTLACLSCHDGVTTFDNLVNAPGEGGLQGVYGDAGSAGYTFMDEGNNGQQGTLGGEDRLNIGKGTSGAQADLSNDHPMSVAYNGGIATDPVNGGDRASLRPTTQIIANINLAAGLFTTQAELRNNLLQNRWAVKGFISTSATIADLLRMNAGNGFLSVECSSCHDPHFKNLSNVDLDNLEVRNGYDAAGVYDGAGTSSGKKSDADFNWAQNLITMGKAGGAVTVVGANNNGPLGTGDRVANNDGLFLRRVGGNAGSGVCRTCHNK